MAQPIFHSLPIEAIRPLTDKAAAIRFGVPSELKQQYQFLPGQYITLRARVDNIEVRRPYSICSDYRDNSIEVGVKRVDHGLFSNYVLDLPVGAKLDVMTPQGRFVCKPGGTHHFLLIAAGSGITPCLSIAKSVLCNEPNSTISLLYGNQKVATTMFRGDLLALKDQFLRRFDVMFLNSQEHQDIAILQGRITKQKLLQLSKLRLFDPARYDGVYLCGPKPMIDELKSGFNELQIPHDRIFSELFSTPDSPQLKQHRASRERLKADVTSHKQGIPVTVIMDGVRQYIHVDGTKETVLIAANRQGLDLPFSCAAGMCCTCRCKVIEGSVNMDVHYSLQEWELDAGFCLACQSRPTSSKLVLDFDAT